MSVAAATTAAAVEAALDRVLDPCSIQVGAPLGLREMGLVTGWQLSDGRLELGLCLTSPGCMLFPRMVEAACEQLAALDEVDEVRVSVDPTVIWSEQRLSAAAGERLARRRALALRRLGQPPRHERSQT